MPRTSRSKLRGKQQQDSVTTKNEAEDKKPVVDNVISTRKRRAAAPIPVISAPKTRNKGKNAKSPIKKQAVKQPSASNKSSPKKKSTESVEDKEVAIGETSRSTRSRLGTTTLRKIPVATLPATTVKSVRTRSMQRKRTESPKKKAMATTEARTVLRANNSNKVTKKKEVETPKKNKKSPRKPKTPTKPQSKVKTKAKKITIKKTPSPQKNKARNTRKSTSQKAVETLEPTKIKVQPQRGRRSTQRSEVAKTPAERKSVIPAITRPRRKMHKSAEDEKKEEETQMEKTEQANEPAEEIKPSDETDVSTTGESKIDDPKEQTKADDQKEQTEMEGVETGEGTGKGKRKLDDEDKDENDVKKAKVAEIDKETEVKEDEKMDVDKKEGEMNENEGIDKANETSTDLVADEEKKNDEVKIEKEEEKKVVDEKKEEEEKKVNDIVENEKDKVKEEEKEKEKEKEKIVEPSINQQNNCQTVTETPPEKLLAAEDAPIEDETPVENSTPTTNGVICETKEVPIVIGRRKFVQNAHVDVKKVEESKEHKFSVASYNLQGIEVDKIKQNIEQLEADIACFQQVQSDYYTNTLQPFLKNLGYVGFHYEGKNDQNGLATFCKTATFEFVDKKECDVYQLLKKDIEERNLDKKTEEALTSFLANAACALYIKLKSVSSQKTMYVCNTSLMPSVHALHALQLAVLVRELTSQSDGTVIPHLMCGILNLEEKHPGFQLLKDGYLNDESITYLQVCKDVAIPGKECAALVDLLWKCFQHSSSSFKNSCSILSKENAPLNTKNSVWHSSDSLRLIGALDLEVEGSEETNDAVPLYVQFDFN